jgi:hypothetical protein
MVNPLAKKLGIKPGMQALILSPPPGYLDSLDPLPEGVEVSAQAKGSYPFIQFFATRRAEVVKTMPKLLKLAAPGAVVWITYPKKTSGMESDLSREILWEAMAPTGWRAVSAVAIDSVWSGLRFRPESDVKSASSRK